jgi:hypothetical protein
MHAICLHFKKLHPAVKEKLIPGRPRLQFRQWRVRKKGRIGFLPAPCASAWNPRWHFCGWISRRLPPARTWGWRQVWPAEWRSQLGLRPVCRLEDQTPAQSFHRRFLGRDGLVFGDHYLGTSGSDLLVHTGARGRKIARSVAGASALLWSRTGVTRSTRIGRGTAIPLAGRPARFRLLP